MIVRNSTQDTRNKTIDYLKAFAIILVVFGHCIQYGLGADASQFFDDFIIKFIYSFHMPLFMLISGYLFSHSITRHSFRDVLVGKVRSLLVPIAVWAIPITLLDTFIYSPERADLWSMFKLYLNEFIGQFWFLWAVLIWSVVVLFINRFLNDNLIAYSIIFIATFIVPNIIAIDELYRFMLPFFIFGYFYGKYKWGERLTRKHIYRLGILSMALFAVMLIFYNKESYIYVSGHSLIHKNNWVHQLYVDMFRIVIGFAGSVFFCVLFKLLSPFIKGIFANAVIYIGSNTIGIYIISFFMVVYALPFIVTEYHGANYPLALLETILILAVCLLLIFLIKRVKWLNRLLLGGR